MIAVLVYIAIYSGSSVMMHRGLRYLLATAVRLGFKHDKSSFALRIELSHKMYE